VRSEPDGVAEDAVVGSPETPSGSTDEDTPESSISPDGDSGERFLPSGNEAGTAPGDRGFRPDVEGLRGVAILLVILFHTTWYPLLGGFVGVDVFFVISGFVITGLLLRERASTGRTSLLSFYARRVRRILPMATFVILAALIATHYLLSHSYIRYAEDDARWALVFLFNIHSSHAFPVFLFPNRPQSPIQQYWSLAIEEQFYLVYPALFMMVAFIVPRWSIRVKLAILLCIVIAASFTNSVISSTSGNDLIPYYQLANRAWELALGGLVAVGANQLKRLPTSLAALGTWVGLAGIVIGALEYKLGSPVYPGSAVALPVVSTALVIAGGTAAPKFGAEMILKLPPIKWLGRWSYSLYLWHFPLLSIAAQRWPHPTLTREFGLLGVAVVLSALTYHLIENPIRRSKFLTRHPALSLTFAAMVVGTCFGLTYVI